MRIPRSLFAACCVLPLFALSSLFPAIARAADNPDKDGLDVNFFYDALKDEGSWFNTTEYGDVWQPYTAYKNDAWRPYTDGYWTFTDGGWMFNSDAAYGWAVYHYGRWTRLKDIGWAWVPGTEWAPAWVTWRSSDPDAPIAPPVDGQAAAAPAPSSAGQGGDATGGGEYVGWAPLPPDAAVNDDADFDYGPTVDADFGIDPDDYCFTDVRFFGAPWIAGVLFDPGRAYYCCGHSVNITHLYYDRRGGYRGVYAGGPNYDRLRGRTERPIPQYRINRQTGAALARQQVRDGRFNRVNGRNVNVLAPRFSRNGVEPGGRIKFNRQAAVAKADVVPGAGRGGGSHAEDQGRAREAFTRQAQDFRGRNPAKADQRGGTATPNNAGPGGPERPAPTKTAGTSEPPARKKQNATPGTPGGNPGGNGKQIQAQPTGGQKNRTHTPTRSGSTHQAKSGGGGNHHDNGGHGGGKPPGGGGSKPKGGGSKPKGGGNKPDGGGKKH